MIYLLFYYIMLLSNITRTFEMPWQMENIYLKNKIKIFFYGLMNYTKITNIFKNNNHIIQYFFQIFNKNI